jgi:hypothetical protein
MGALSTQCRFGDPRVERLQPRRCEKLSGKDGSPLGCALDLFQLLRALGIFARGLEKKFRVDLDDGEEIVELVRDEAGGLVRFLEAL